MTTKIKSISITGIRGIKESILLPLNEKSILLYGDNGTGKSSISDAIEWFYTDKVSHLSGSEIDLKDALRNSYQKDTDIASIAFSYNRNVIDATKSLFSKRGKLTSELSNSSDDFQEYYSASQSENLLLRYQFLRDFIDQTKGDKLKYLSDIIGFSEVTKTKDVLRKAFSSIKSEIKAQNFEAQINNEKQTLIAKIGAAVSQERNLFEIINEIIEPLKTGITVNSIDDIDTVLNRIKRPVNTKQIEELQFLENTSKTLSTLKDEISFIDGEYEKYFSEFNKIADDVQSIMQTFFIELLKSGETVITKKYHKEDNCPLCLQEKNLEELRTDIQRRLKEIEGSSKKKATFDTAKKSITDIVVERLKRLEPIVNNTLLNDRENENIKKFITNLSNKLAEYQKAANEKVTSGNKLPVNDVLILCEDDFKIQEHIFTRIEELGATIKNDKSTEFYANISAAKDAFLKIKRFEKDKSKLEYQKDSLELIYNEFVKRQKEGLESFINTFSTYINEFYQYMNPGEQFHEIRIVTIGEDDELNGITIEYKYNDEWVSPPQKYFSESHLNCFGISFFLASVIAFNKKNKFIVLDDVISSFDSTHRKRFADLLFEKFANYQFILLTHEAQWFSYVRQLAKRKGWKIEEIKWTEAKGAHLEEKPNDLKEFIERELANSSIETLGNPIRKYLEAKLKDICLNLEVKVNFRLNDVNEKRMADELLNELKSRIKDKGGQDLKAKIPIIERVANSSILGNLLSHDNPFDAKIGDLKAFWEDIKELESVFYCQETACKRPEVSMKNYDSVANKVRCGCDKIKYDWKK
ncbi:RecF/RecN/SMC N terminal domain-containing protein [Porphyromonadaceae bacterium NLAE-zl-C104]|nr:RecF/RecN/SMC N terminal domain-containing protein [Porphyromonadaceae bacterium NLAE-zl-C104]